MEPDAMHIIVDYVDNVPFMYYFKDGLIEEKVVSWLLSAFLICDVMQAYLFVLYLVTRVDTFRRRPF